MTEPGTRSSPATQAGDGEIDLVIKIWNAEGDVCHLDFSEDALSNRVTAQHLAEP